MKILGLTGSIAMGKSTTAKMFAAQGVPVYDADAAVAELYAKGGAAVAAIRALAPEAVVGDAVDRTRLRAALVADPDLLKKIEAEVHPLVAQKRAAFLSAARAAGVGLVVLDIPLLYETGGDAFCDAVVVVTAPPDVQMRRVLARPGMTEATFDAILVRQMADDDKRARADYVIDTSNGLAAAELAVATIISDLGADHGPA